MLLVFSDDIPQRLSTFHHQSPDIARLSRKWSGYSPFLVAGGDLGRECTSWNLAGRYNLLFTCAEWREHSRLSLWISDVNITAASDKMRKIESIFIVQKIFAGRLIQILTYILVSKLDHFVIHVKFDPSKYSSNSLETSQGPKQKAVRSHNHSMK